MRGISPPRPDRLFFPAALALALCAVPVQVLWVSGMVPLPAALPYWHGHEMLFGFAYAVIGGYLLTGYGWPVLWAAFAAWLLGRLAMFAADGPFWLLFVLLPAYPLMLAALAGRRFARAAKTGRNAVFAVILAALGAADLFYLLGVAGVLPEGGYRGLLFASDMIVMLLFAMGGRIIAAASSGAHQTQGRPIGKAAQPGLERAGLFCLALVLLSDLTGGPAAVASLAGMVAGVVALCRLHHWRIWRIWRNRAVSLLHLGYAWIGIGLCLRALMTPWLGLGQATLLHPVFVGGLGTLALSMMLRVTMQRNRQPIHIAFLPAAAILSISFSALARLLAFLDWAYVPALWTAALFWCLGFLLLLAVYRPLFNGQTPAGKRR